MAKLEIQHSDLDSKWTKVDLFVSLTMDFSTSKGNALEINYFAREPVGVMVMV